MCPCSRGKTEARGPLGADRIARSHRSSIQVSADILTTAAVPERSVALDVRVASSKAAAAAAAVAAGD